MKILFFSDIHFHHTHRFSHITSDGFTIRELEHISCADKILELADKHKIDKIICGGDCFGPVGDSVSSQVLTAMSEFFRKICERYTIDVLVGNHDLSSTTNNKYSHKLIPFKYWSNINVYDVPTVCDNFVYMPFCSDNTYAQTFLEGLRKREEKIVFSHLEIKGINLGNEIITQHGVELDLLKEFKVTLQGHYHSGKNLAKNVLVSGSTQRLSFKDKGIARNNIIIYDTETGKYIRESFNCPDWLTFTDDNLEDLLKIEDNNYVKIDISSDLFLTPEIQEKLQKVKDKDIHIDITRIVTNKKVTEDIEVESNSDILVQFINKSDNDEHKKMDLIRTGNGLLDKVVI